MVTMTQGVRGEDLWKRGERGRHWEEEVEAMVGPPLLVCVHGLGVESEPGTQSSCQPQKRRDHRTRSTAPRSTTRDHHTALSWSLAVNFGRKLLSARGATNTTPVWFRPSLSIAPGTSLLLLTPPSWASGRRQSVRGRLEARASF